MASSTKIEAMENLNALGACPLCGSEAVEVRWDDAADLTGYCRDCKEYFEI